jgi:HSP20 family protein
MVCLYARRRERAVRFESADVERRIEMLAKWNPFNGGIARSSSVPEFDDLFREADSLLRSSFFNDQALPSSWWTSHHLGVAADVIETENEIQVKMDLPGHDPKSLQVRLEGDTLTIQSERKQQAQEPGQSFLRAERSHGVFARSFVLPGTVDAQKCEAKYESGVLTVTAPKREEAKPRTLTIKVQS